MNWCCFLGGVVYLVLEKDKVKELELKCCVLIKMPKLFSSFQLPNSGC